MNKKINLLFLTFILFIPLSFALTITQNEVQVISTTSVNFTISTDPASIVHIYYSATASADTMLLQPNPGSTRRVTHHINLPSLVSGQRYYYQILAFNSQDSITDNNSNQFYTFLVGQPGAPGQAPIVDNVLAQALGPGSTAIRWTTDIAANAKVHYGIGNTDQTRDRASTATQQELVIPTQSGENYQFYVESCTDAGLCGRSQIQGFTAGGAQGPLAIQLEVNISETSSRTSIDIPVQTIPLAKVEVFVDGMRKRISNPSETGDDGLVVFYDIPLTPDQSNEVKIVASDATGASSEITQHVMVDITPPSLNLNPLSGVASSAITVTGIASEPVTITYTSELTGVSQLPIVGNLQNRSAAGPNRVRLQWSIDPIFNKYAVYANGVMVAEVSQGEYEFTQGAPGANILFTVTGITTECRMSDISAGFNVAFSGSGGNLSLFTQVQSSCQHTSQSIEANGAFSLPISLVQGRNLITLNAIDKAGNTAEEEFEVLYDTQIPSFVMEETNIADLSPVYDDIANIRGRVTEQAAVYIYVNEDIDTNIPTYITSTDEEGRFYVPVELKRDPVLFETGIALGTGVGSAESSGWHNRIKIKAIDEAGQESADQRVYDLIFAKCGQGGVFSVDIDPPTRAVHADEILDGTAEIYFSINLDYPDDETFQVNGRDYPRYQILRPPALHASFLSKAEQDKIDQFKQVGAPTIMWDREFKHGTASVSVHGYDFNGNEPEDRQEMLDLIAETNKGKCAAGAAGDIYGCIQVPLELEISYAENRPGYQTTPQGGVISQTGLG